MTFPLEFCNGGKGQKTKMMPLLEGPQICMIAEFIRHSTTTGQCIGIVGKCLGPTTSKGPMKDGCMCYSRNGITISRSTCQCMLLHNKKTF